MEIKIFKQGEARTCLR